MSILCFIIQVVVTRGCEYFAKQIFAGKVPAVPDITRESEEQIIKNDKETEEEAGPIIVKITCDEEWLIVEPLSEELLEEADVESDIQTTATEKEAELTDRASPGKEDPTLKELLRVDEQYVPLLTLLEQFCLGESLLEFNRNLIAFENTLSSMCPDEASLHQAFATFRAAALLSAETARKLAAVGAACTRQHRHRMTGALIEVILETFAKLDVLEWTADLECLINAANLLGDYFAEVRKSPAYKWTNRHTLAGPLLQYMRALLRSHDSRAHRCLSAQLHQNFEELRSVLGDVVFGLSISIRYRLTSTPERRNVWLLHCMYTYAP